MPRFLIKCSRTIDYEFVVEGVDAYDAANNGLYRALTDGHGGQTHLISATDNGIDKPWEVTEVADGDVLDAPTPLDFHWL
jgi:hypothetical protein